jgi:DnaJ-class molecular chaperone
MTVEEKGLPFHKNPYKFGNLFVLFNVKFPISLDAVQLDSVKSLLSDQKKKGVDEDMDCDEVVKIK